jgi:hypothetical protein
MDEDVLWIITPEERAQFMALSTNDERDPNTSNYQTTIMTRKDVDIKFLDTCRCGEFLLGSPRSN